MAYFGSIGKKEPIKVWRFSDAPSDLQKLSTNGGDEDWIAAVADEQEVPNWIHTSAFGCCCVDKYYYGKYTIYIGAHS
jgi:hypothetical protein